MLKKTTNILYLSLLCCLFLAISCEKSNLPKEEGTAQETAPTLDDSITRKQSLGPVTATVTLKPSKPKLGDPVELTLQVSAKRDVAVVMPPFGEQLGRFSIADYKPRESISEDGSTEYEQVYTLDLPMSGSLKAPSFLIEFTDNRKDAENAGVVQEMLTEDFSFEVLSVLPEGEIITDLRPAIGALEELKIPSKDSKQLKMLIVAGVIIIVLLIAFLLYLRSRRSTPALLPHELALQQLKSLEEEEIPKDPDGIDAWYVRLSGILRHYIEGRFGLSAPTRTTEEFFILANQSQKLSQEQKRSLRRILEKSDRVKFTDFIPGEEESRESLNATRDFVEESKPRPEAENDEIRSESQRS